MNEGSTIGGRLGGLRRERGLTQEQLAEKAGLSKAVITNLEYGRRDSVRISSLVALADALGTEAGELLGGGRDSWSPQAERDRELGARVRQLLAACGMRPRELEAVLSAGMPGVPAAKRATLAGQVAFMAAELRALRAEVRALARPEGGRP